MSVYGGVSSRQLTLCDIHDFKSTTVRRRYSFGVIEKKISQNPRLRVKLLDGRRTHLVFSVHRVVGPTCGFSEFFSRRTTRIRRIVTIHDSSTPGRHSPNVNRPGGTVRGAYSPADGKKRKFRPVNKT